MPRLSRNPPGLPSALAGLLLFTASCGDLQDPASGTSAQIAAVPDAQAPYLTQPSLDPSSQQPAFSPAPAPADQDLPASGPLPAQSRNTPGGNEPPSSLPASQPVPPADPPSPNGSGNAPPWQTSESPVIRRVTLTWDPSSSGDPTGYRVYVRSDPTVEPSYFDAGPVTQLTMSLIVGNRYFFTVTAYNAAGESPPADEITFDVN
jgi:Fibronectin type III domain